MVNYPLGDFLIRIKNAAIGGRKEVEFPSNKVALSVAKVLEKAGYLESVTNSKGVLKVNLKIKSKKPLILNIRLVSKPGLRVYRDIKVLKKHRGASMLVLSTPKGMVSGAEAVKLGTGGEVIAEVW